MYIIGFEPVGRRREGSDNDSLLTCARHLGIGISSVCGGKGTCHSCKVQVLSGNTSGPSTCELEAYTTEEIKDGWRLTCQTYPKSDCKMNIPAESIIAEQFLSGRERCRDWSQVCSGVT